MPSTLRMNTPTGSIIPIQQFINESRKSKNREPKYNRSQPDQPDPQSVLRTRTRQGYNLSFYLLYDFYPFYFYKLPFPGTQQLYMKLAVYFILFQITFPKCHKIYPTCIWHVPSEWSGLNFNSALFTKVYWNYATHIVRVCVATPYPINPQLHCSKCNLQVRFGSRAMSSLYELLCHHSLTNNDPLLEKLVSYVRARFPSHFFEFIAYEISYNESSRSIDSSVSAFYSNDST